MIFKTNPNLIQCTVVSYLHLINDAEVWVTSWCGSGQKHYFILGTTWASAELSSCSCLLLRRDGRKRWAERYERGREEKTRGRRDQAGRTSTAGWEGAHGADQRSAFNECGGPKERGIPSPTLLQAEGLSPGRGLPAGTHQPLLPSAGSPLGLPFLGWPSRQLQLMNMQSAATYAADR